MGYTAAEIGTLLREERERKELNTSSIARELKIRKKYLDEIEAGNFETLPCRLIYVVGFIKAYASYLGFDANEIVENYKEEEENKVVESEFKFPEMNNKSMVPHKSIMVASIVVAMVAYSYFNKQYEIDGIFKETIEKISVQYNKYMHQYTDSSVFGKRKSLSTSSNKNIVKVRSRAVLLAKDSTLIRIYDKKGKFIAEENLQAGDTYFVPDREDLIVSTGDANAIEVFSDNEQQSFLGTLGQIK